MVAQLTRGERQLSLLMLLALAVVGLLMAAAGRTDPFGVHGWIVLLSSGALAAFLLSRFGSPLPDPERLSRYYDDPIKVGIALTMIWAVFGMLVGVWVAS
jgi:cytochrome c oxidase cbb3-type subunit 1